MAFIEDKDIPLYIRKREYRDIDIKNLAYIDAFVQKYIRQILGNKFNTGIDKIPSQYWDDMLADLICVYEEKWKQVIVTEDNKSDVIERVLGKYNANK